MQVHFFHTGAQGPFTINVRRTFRFLDFLAPSPLTDKCPHETRYQNENVRSFFAHPSLGDMLLQGDMLCVLECIEGLTGYPFSALIRLPRTKTLCDL